ncbi:hypothetical protein BKA70DRAFT_1320280, partial [Coprinopsis sp. MPI-PUGE-AT-0042]
GFWFRSLRCSGCCSTLIFRLDTTAPLIDSRGASIIGLYQLRPAISGQRFFLSYHPHSPGALTALHLQGIPHAQIILSQKTSTQYT